MYFSYQSLLVNLLSPAVPLSFIVFYCCFNCCCLFLKLLLLFSGYARYLLGNMYYPYLPYLPATESLALFAQNSNVAQMEAALQAQAVQHRIYDLQKG